jgi:hypothetical protein
MMNVQKAAKIFVVAVRLFGESIAVSYGGAYLAFLTALGMVWLFGDHRWYAAITDSPTFLLPILAGVLLAVALKNIIWKTSYLAWIVPSLVLYRVILGLYRTPDASNATVWDTIIGTNCQSTECLYQTFFTGPAICGLAYSLACVCISIIRQFTNNSVVAAITKKSE